MLLRLCELRGSIKGVGAYDWGAPGMACMIPTFDMRFMHTRSHLAFQTILDPHHDLHAFPPRYPDSPPALEPGCNDDSADIDDDDKAPSAQQTRSDEKGTARISFGNSLEAVAKATQLCPLARTIAAETIVINAMQELKESGGKLTGQMHDMSDFVHGVAESDRTMKTRYVFMMQPSPKTVTFTIPSTNMTL